MESRCVQIAVSFAGTDMFELPANVREVVDQGLRNDVVTDINLRPVIFDEADKTRDGKESGPLFGFMWGTSTDDLEVCTFQIVPVNACPIHRSLF